MKQLPSIQVMQKAFNERDPEFEGIFFVAVKTTGIFCRPTCPARKPKPENVEYFASPKEAMYHGYRACLRCHPLVRNQPIPSLVKELSERIEKNPEYRITDAELKTLGIEPTTARRQFRKHYGMTFHAYQRARRMGLALKQIRNGDSVIGAQLENGYESASGFWEACKKLFGQPASKAEEMDLMLAKWLETPLGPMVALANDEGIHMLEFIDRKGLENEILTLRKKVKTPVVPGENDHLRNLTEQLEEYFNGQRLHFDLPILPKGTEFERQVWQQLHEIPPGTTSSYGEMAAKLRNPKAVRALGRANGKNCIAILIPCHRVIGADGKLVGYGGGLWRKKWLLEHERSILAGRIK